ncbi:pilus assembly protein [Evansella sp. LMS18]|uniref:TadE/TadG family type IV pilus assembly protein n=1 Tax=Evansella sp. LMS18 TaxID=2924033 RepID=UPI0020D04C0D|nr:TadE family protein [Evansella sp. LMS18]UTR11088.1 pilus assembly protein [Evansella sp. LMS18]
MRKIIKRYTGNEKGSQTIEFVAIFPLLIFAIFFVWQVSLVAYALVVTEAAARDGARAASVEGDYVQAVENSAVGLQLAGTPTRSIGSSGYGEEVTVTVVTKVPFIQMPILNNLDQNITRSVTMPYEGESD